MFFPLSGIKNLPFHAISLKQILHILWPSFLTPWSTVLLERLTGIQLVKKHLPPVLSWASSIQSTTPLPEDPILILSSHLCLYSPIRATWPAHLILLDFITRTILGEGYQSLSSPLCSFLRSPVASFLLGPNILLNVLFSYTLSQRSSLNVRDQVSHPYNTTCKIIVLYNLKWGTRWRSWSQCYKPEGRGFDSR